MMGRHHGWLERRKLRAEHRRLARRVTAKYKRQRALEHWISEKWGLEHGYGTWWQQWKWQWLGVL